MIMVQRHPASFKDPSGFIFRAEGRIYRQVNTLYTGAYHQLMDSGLYESLTQKGWLIKHTETNEYNGQFPETFKILLPEQIRVISYPAEWCFEQLQDAALLTLNIALEAINKGMVLKDATPFNIQILGGRPVWIDTLSFEPYAPEQPWVAYRQFCETMLYPLLLAHYKGLNMPEIFSAWPDGVPATIASGLLPVRTKLNMGVALHVHLPASAYSKQKSNTQKTVSFNHQKMVRMLQHLQTVVARLKKGKRKSVWADYYQNTILSQQYLAGKEEVCKQILSGIAFETVIDAGCNDGNFTKMLAATAKHIVATDSDGECISELYRHIKKNRIENILPLVADLARPTPATGVNNTERAALLERCTADLVLALALVHHLVIGRNIPFASVAATLAGMGNYLLIEFVPLTDEKAQQLLAGREQLFHHYTETAFATAFEQYYHIESAAPVAGSSRKIYLMKKVKNTINVPGPSGEAGTAIQS
jgi:ribosomal protein L11 methylase PrmA